MAFYGVGIDSEVVRVIGDIKLQLSNRYGSYGLRQMDLALKRASASLAHGAGLHPTEFIQTLKDLGVFLKQIQEQALKKYFICKQGTGTIDHASFVNSFRENLTSKREKIVREVFQRIDVNNNGAIEPEELSKYWANLRQILQIQLQF